MADGTIKIGMELDGSNLDAEAKRAGDSAAAAASKSFSQIEASGSGAFSAVATVGAAAFSAIASGVVALTSLSIEAFGQYEQLAGGAAKIFDELDQSAILADANQAYKTLNMSANQYLATINDVGASFAATMGDQAGYDTAKLGMQAIADYASGTGRNVDELMAKFTMITRSTASYQSIADQFSGILPATSKGFLEQAQAAGILSDEYSALTEVPMDEYQRAVAEMLELGVKNLGLYGNTAAETSRTITGSIAGLKATWENWLVGLADPDADLSMLTEQLLGAIGTVADNILPAVERIGSALIDNLPMVLSGVAGTLASILRSALSTAWSLALEGMAAIGSGDFASSVADSLGSALDDAFGEIDLGGVFADLGFGDTFTELNFAIGMLQGYLETLGDTFENVFSRPEVTDSLTAIWDALVGIADTVVGSVLAAVGMLYGIVEPFIPALGELAAAVLPILQGALEGLGGYISFVAELFLFLLACAQPVADFLGAVLLEAIQLISPLLEGIGGILSWLGGAWSTAAEDIRGFTETAVSAISGFFESVGAFFGNIISSVQSFAQSFGENARSAAEDFGRNLMSGLQELPGRVISIGSDIISGIAQGIQSAGSMILDTLMGAVGGAIDAVKNFLGIASPSKLMRDLIGVNMGEGAAIGVEVGWRRKDPFGSLRRDVEQGMSGLQIEWNGRFREGSSDATKVTNYYIDGIKFNDDPQICRNVRVFLADLSERYAMGEAR